MNSFDMTRLHGSALASHKIDKAMTISQNTFFVSVPITSGAGVNVTIGIRQSRNHLQGCNS